MDARVQRSDYVAGQTPRGKEPPVDQVQLSFEYAGEKRVNVINQKHAIADSLNPS